MTTYALILAGGRGSRLGDVRKAKLRIGGEALFARVARHLPRETLLVSTGPGEPHGFGTGIALRDSEVEFTGPMAGIRAATDYLRGAADKDDLLITTAVDTPFLPANYHLQMQRALDGGADAAYASWGELFYPTNAIYRLSALTAFLENESPDSPKLLLRGLSAVAVDWIGLSRENPFANLNTLDDLITLGRRANSLK